jgi:hypothetical protein
VDAVALHPVGAGVRALGDPYVDARLHQPVGQAQPPDPTADDENIHTVSIISQTDE